MMRLNISVRPRSTRFSFEVLLLAAATACGYDSTTPYPAPQPSTIDGLWTSSASDPAVLRLSPDQLVSDGAHVPATVVVTSSAELFALNAVAFDTDGTIWVTSSDDSTLVAFAPGNLSHSGGPDATVVIRPNNEALAKPTGLAFDNQHRLWVANSGNGTIARFDRTQLTTGGAASPSMVIVGPGKPTALAFDSHGALWVSNNATNKIVSYSPAQLATGGPLTPQVVLSSLGTTLNSPAGLAFDAAGNLWVANTASETLVAFSPAQLAVTGSPVPRVTLTSNNGSLGIPVGLAFDSNGALWMIGGSGALEKFSRASLATSGAPAPESRHRLSGFVLFWSLAFWPKVPGLPLN